MIYSTDQLKNFLSMEIDRASTKYKPAESDASLYDELAYLRVVNRALIFVVNGLLDIVSDRNAKPFD